MLKQAFLGVISIFAISAATLYADPKDDIKAAVQKVADSPNYSWSTTVSGGRGGGPQDGKTEKDGYTLVTMQFRDTPFDIVMKDHHIAVKTDSGWKSAAEIMGAAADDAGGPPPPERIAVMIAERFRTPIEQAKGVLDDLQNIQKTDDGFTADLSADSAKKLMSIPPRRNASTNPDNGAPPPPQIDVTDAKGTLKMSIKDGVVSKTELHLTGTVSFNGGEGREMNRTISTEIKDVGSTTVTVPDDAKAKLAP